MFDNAILKLLRSKPEKGMSVLMDNFTPLVYTIVKNKLSPVCTPEDIEETVSDVFIAFYNQLDSVDLSKGNLSAYITTIARRKAVDKYRTRPANNEISINDDTVFIDIPDSVHIENETEKRLLIQRLIEEINALGEPDRTIVYRKYFLSETSRDIANFLGISDNSVRLRLMRALRKIEANMKED